jgi:maleate isomerase
LRLQDNFSFAEVPEATVAEMIRDVAREGCDAVAVVCTNMRGAGLVEALEDEIGVPIYDSIAVTVWKSFAVAGLDPARIEGWGSLFGGVPAAQAGAAA